MTEAELIALRNTIVDEVRSIAAKAETETKAQGDALAATRTELENAKTTLADTQKSLLDLQAKMRAPGMGGGIERKDEDEGAALRRKAFFNFFRKGSMDHLPEVERKALVEDATGSILVPYETEAEIYRALPKVTVMRGLAGQRTISGEKIRRRSMTEVQVGWGKLETGTPVTDTTLVPAEEFQYVEDLAGLAKIGRDELADTDVNLESYLVESFAIAMGEKEDSGFMVGRGHTTYQEPEGIFVTSALSATTYNAGQDGAVTVDDFITLRQYLAPQYRAGASWLMNASTELALMILKDKEDQYLWQPSNQAGAPNLLLGYPVFNQEDIADVPDSGTAALVAAFGNFKLGYRIVDRQGILMQRLVEAYATAGIIGFLATKRVTGGVVRPKAIVRLNVPAS